MLKEGKNYFGSQALQSVAQPSRLNPLGVFDESCGEAVGSAVQLPKLLTPQRLDPSHGSALASDMGAVTSWLEAHHLELLEAAMVHGAVLFRGFAARELAQFDQFRLALPFVAMPYIGGAAVRQVVFGEHLFTTNESPPSEPVPFHHELSQTIEPPDYITFFCQLAAEEGGETPLVDSRAVYRFMAEQFPEFTHQLNEHGVKYVRVMPPQDDDKSAIGRSWRSTWQTQSNDQAEEKMLEQGMAWEWLKNGDLKTTTKAMPATRIDNRTGEHVFFNSMIAAYKGWTDARNDPRYAVRLGNDEPLDCAILEAIYEYMLSIKVALPWQPGDILFIDNWVTMHARNPFKGPRKILAAIGQRMSSTE